MVRASRASLVHISRLEQLVISHAPILWRLTLPRLRRWLRTTLAALRPTLDILVIETRVATDPEILLLEQLIMGLEVPPFDPLELTTLIEDLSTRAALQAGFLPTDPRADTIRARTQEMLEAQVSRYWRTLTDPETLASRLTTLRREGLGYTQLSQAVADQYGTEFYRAERLVRSSFNTGSNYAHLEALREAGYTKKRFVTARDKRVRHGGKSRFNHRDMDGQVVRIDEPFVTPEGFLLMYPGDASLGAPIGTLVNCFPEDTLVQFGGLEQAYRRWYEGDLIEVATASGHKLAGTPNHPILTDRGWVALGLLDEGDSVVHGAFVQKVGIGNPHIKNVPAQIGEVFDSLAVEGVDNRIRGLNMDFHGDGGDSHVDIVWTDSLLQNHVEATGFYPLGKHHLARTHLNKRSLSAEGNLPVMLATVSLPLARTMSGPGKLSPFGDRALSHAVEHGLASPPWGNASLEQARPYGIARDPVSLSKRLFALPIQVTSDQFINGQVDALTQSGAASSPVCFDTTLPKPCSKSMAIYSNLSSSNGQAVTFVNQLERVVNLRRVNFAGHVYNLQTRQGWYIANGIIAHNCRCTTVGVET